MAPYEPPGAAPLTFDERLRPLADLIGSVTRPGDYCTHGRLFAPMPRVEAGEAGALSFPVLPVQVQALVAEAERAPYGRGPETILDRSVRDCWQIDASRVAVSGGAWSETFADILRRTAAGLGYPAEAVSASLYKLLLYELGGFFAPHRDTEKADGMVGTLVLSLPVAGAGGELVVRHRDRETVIDMTTAEPSELVHAAFYADCEHEIRPVTEGHRVCLVYNLTVADRGIPLDAPDHAAEVEAIAAELRARCRDPETSGKVVWVLEHDYSEAGLAFGALKNADDAVGRVLAAAAERAGCSLHAAIVHVQEVGAAQFNGDGYDDLDDENYYEMLEVDDVDCRLDDWVGMDGAAVDFGELPLLAGELMPEGCLDEAEPDTQRLMEASGNAGVDIERLYRHAALVAWPRDDAPRVLAPAGAGALAALLGAERAQAGTTGRGALPELAARVVDAWPSPPSWRPVGDGDDSWWRHVADALTHLCGIGNADATRRFLQDVVVPHYGGRLNDAIAALAVAAGAGESRGLLRDLVRANLSGQAEGIVDLVWQLRRHLDEGGDAAWEDTLRETVVTLCEAMPSVSPRRGAEDEEAAFRGTWHGIRPPRKREPKRLSAAALRKFFELVWRFDLEREAGAATAFFIGHPELVLPDRTVPGLLEALRAARGDRVGGSAAVAALWRHGAEYLLGRSEFPPEPPTDWVIPVKRRPCTCEYCTRLWEFCADPVAEVREFAVRGDLRQHLRESIAAAEVDIEYSTRREGRPYKLVCTKTRATWRNRQRQYQEDAAEMRRLAGLAAVVPGSADLAERLLAAADRAG